MIIESHSVCPSVSAGFLINLFHLVLLVRVMIKAGGPWWKKPINMMILMDEAARHLGSIGIAYVLFQIGSILNDVGDLSYCPFLHLAVIGIFWNIIGGAGKINII